MTLRHPRSDSPVEMQVPRVKRAVDREDPRTTLPPFQRLHDDGAEDDNVGGGVFFARSAQLCVRKTRANATKGKPSYGCSTLYVHRDQSAHPAADRRLIRAASALSANSWIWLSAAASRLHIFYTCTAPLQLIHLHTAVVNSRCWIPLTLLRSCTGES